MSSEKQVRDAIRAARARDMAEYFEQLPAKYDGSPVFLLHAVAEILQEFAEQHPATETITADFRKAIQKWNNAEVRTLDDAFGVTNYRKGQHLDKIAEQEQLGQRIVDAVKDRLAEPMSLTAAYEDVGETFGLNKDRVRDIYQWQKDQSMKSRYLEIHAAVRAYMATGMSLHESVEAVRSDPKFLARHDNIETAYNFIERRKPLK